MTSTKESKTLTRKGITDILDAIAEVKSSPKAYNSKWRTARLSTIYNAIIDYESALEALASKEAATPERLQAEFNRGYVSGRSDTLAEEAERTKRAEEAVETLNKEIRGIRTYKVMAGFRSDYYVPLPLVISAIQKLRFALLTTKSGSLADKNEGTTKATQIGSDVPT